MQASRHTQNTAGASARMGWAARLFSRNPAKPSAWKNINRAPTVPRTKNSTMAVRKIFRFSFSRPWAWAWLVSLEMARGRPAVEKVNRKL